MDPSLGLFLAIMGSICMGLAMSLWLAVRSRRPAQQTLKYVCFQPGCSFQVTLLAEELDILVETGKRHQETAHGG